MSSMKIWSMIFAGRGADVAVSCKKNLSPFVIALGAQIAAVPATLAQSELGKVTSRVEGVVMVARRYDISTEVSNKTNRLRFVQRQFVKRGDLLVEFDVELRNRHDVDAIDMDRGAEFGFLNSEARRVAAFLGHFDYAKRGIRRTLLRRIRAHADNHKEVLAIDGHGSDVNSGVNLLLFLDGPLGRLCKRPGIECAKAEKSGQNHETTTSP